MVVDRATAMLSPTPHDMLCVVTVRGNACARMLRMLWMSARARDSRRTARQFQLAT